MKLVDQQENKRLAFGTNSKQPKGVMQKAYHIL
jgi:hypothetical protein